MTTLRRRDVLQLGGMAAVATGLAGIVPRTHGATAGSGTAAQPKQRVLGASGIAVPPMGLGCMGMSEFYGPSDTDEVSRTLDAALERGVNFLDTADMYGRGANEELLSPRLKQRRSRIVLATRFGIVRDAGGVHFDHRPAYVKAACEASLRRLKTDYIDLYYAHRIDRRHPVEDMTGKQSTSSGNPSHHERPGLRACCRHRAAIREQRKIS